MFDYFLLGSYESVQVKRSVVAQHVIDGSTEFDRQCVHCSSLASFLFQTLGKLFHFVRFPFEDLNRFAKSPAQVGVSHLSSWRTVVLARRGVAPFDQAAVGKKIANAGESLDVLYLVHQRQAQDGSDAGDRSETVVKLRMSDLGLFDQF